MAALRDKQKHRRIQEIIDTAVKLIQSKGFDRTTIEDIAAEALVAPATVYNYFGSKQGLLRRIVAQHIEERERMRQPFLSNPPADVHAAVHQFVDLLLDTSLDRLSREMWSQVIAADFIAGNEKSEMIGQVTAALLAQFQTLYTELQKRGSLRADVSVRSLSEASLGIADFHFYRMVSDPTCSIHRTKVRTKSQLDLLLNGLTPASENVPTRNRKMRAKPQ